MIHFHCPNCGLKFKVKDEHAGRSTKCPTCKNAIQVPAASPPVAQLAPGPVDGSASSVQQADVDEGVTLRPPPGREGAKPVGDILAGKATDGRRYLVDKEIARGGMGAVVRAIDRDLRREVAVKFMLDHSNATHKKRFVEEAQITGQLEHPNIVPIHELGIDGQKRMFFAMKMVHGRSLADILKQKDEGGRMKDEFPLHRLLTVMMGVCHALAYAHSRSVIHRDLKPANIMVGDFGEVYVMDWGLAKVVQSEEPIPMISADPSIAVRPGHDNISMAKNIPMAAPLPSHATSAGKVVTSRDDGEDLTQAGAIMGTPVYMPPEQAKGLPNAVDQRSDIYSLGAILYELLTLVPPVEKDGGHIAVLMRVVKGEILPPEVRTPERRHKIPPELSAIAMKALALEPSQRYQTVEALRLDLELYLAGRSVSAKQDTFGEQAWKLVKRNKGASIASSAAIVILTFVVGYFMKINYDARVLAESSYQNFLTEQKAKNAQAKQSAPIFVRAALLAIADRQFEDALAQTEVALANDSEQTEAYLIKGQLLLALERFSEAVAPLEQFATRSQGDANALALLELARDPQPDRGSYFHKLGAIFLQQKRLTLSEQMSKLSERFVGPQREKIPLYRKRLEAVWPNVGGQLVLDNNGEFHLRLDKYIRDVDDLSPLKGIPIHHLTLAGNSKVTDLLPLKDMPLKSLILENCKQLRDLGPLEGTKLRKLDLSYTMIADLSPLRTMPLRKLDLRGCGRISSLEPLRDSPLDELTMNDCGSITDLSPLQGKSLKQLDLTGCKGIKDLAPLRGMLLEALNLSGTSVRNLEPLTGMPLQRLILHLNPITDLDALKGVSLKHLSLNATRELRNLEGLRGAPLQSLILAQCWSLKDLQPLRGMPIAVLHILESKDLVIDNQTLRELPLTSFMIPDHKGIKDLEFLRGKPLTFLNISNCPHITSLEPLREAQLEILLLQGCGIADLGPLERMSLREIHFTPHAIKNGMQVLRGMKSLEWIHPERGLKLPPNEFWKRYDAGEFKK